MNNDTLESLRWHKFPILDKGYVCLVDWLGDDAAICRAARTSYGAGTKHVSDDRTLLRHMMRHNHSSPFEFVEVVLQIKCPMDLWRQQIRHRTASVCEYSTRFSEAIEDMAETCQDRWRLQSVANKQGSAGFLGEETGKWLTQEESALHGRARAVYRHRIECGVAREQARKDLPLSNYTMAYWKIDGNNLLRYLELRMDQHAQQEIRELATTIGEKIVAKLFPETWEAFCDYRLNALKLTALDVKVIREVSQLPADLSAKQWESEVSAILDNYISNKREREECDEKLRRLGL